VIVAAVLTGRKLYRTYLRRIPGAMKISEGFFRKRSLLGRVTSVGDGDGCRLFHTPGGRLAGWGWLPGRRIPTGKALKDQTVGCPGGVCGLAGGVGRAGLMGCRVQISIRIAGIDAPEAAHFGRPAQPGSQEALDWLTGYIKHARVRARIYRRDQYERAIATVYVRKWFIKRDVGYEMLKRGLATIYEAKTGSEFGLLEKEYREAEAKAKARKLGLWAQNKETFESPREYKTRMGMTPKDKEE
jgi:endonuclease YncB( thermonuclease family)